jgi:hypothetical protein
VWRPGHDGGPRKWGVRRRVGPGCWKGVSGGVRREFEREFRMIAFLRALRGLAWNETADDDSSAVWLTTVQVPLDDLSATQSRLRVLSAPPHAPSRVLCPAGAAG